MKRTLFGVLSAAIVLSLCMSAAFAAGPGGGRCFADADGDGICDNAGSGCTYSDADGDGICDNYAPGQGAGYGRGCHGGRGHGFRGGCGR